MSAASEAVRLRKASSMSGSVSRTATSSSKAEAERLVRAAQQQGGISAVARPSIVVGCYRDGTIGQFTHIYALIRLVTAGRIHTLPASPCGSLDFVPIDHVIGGLTDIAERMAAAAGRTYHLVSGAPVPVAALRTLALGYPHLPCTRRASCHPKTSSGPG